MTIDSTEDTVGGVTTSPLMRRLSYAILAIVAPLILGQLIIELREDKAYREEGYYYRIADHYCGPCHRSLGSWSMILDLAAETDGGLQRFMLDNVQAEFMPPSAWHREQLIKILEEGDR